MARTTRSVDGLNSAQRDTGTSSPRKRGEMVGLTDKRKCALSLTHKLKGKPYTYVPAEVLERLDQHMVAIGMGLSEVTERNERILLRHIALALLHPGSLAETNVARYIDD